MAEANRSKVTTFRERVSYEMAGPTILELEQNEDGPTLGMGAVCYCLGLSPETVRPMLQYGDLRGVLIGRNYRVLWRSLRAYMFTIGALPLTEGERNCSTIKQGVITADVPADTRLRA